MTVLKIQPGPTDGYDTYIDEQNPATNYQTSQTLYCKGPSPNRKRAFLNFWFNTLPYGAQISKAELAVYVHTQSGSKNLRMTQVIDAWYVDTLTWNNRPIPGASTVIKEASAGSWVTFDVRALVEYWIANPEWNLGVDLFTDLCTASNIEFYSSDYLADPTLRPYIEITYTMGGLVASDTWLGYARYIFGCTSVTWIFGSYRYLTPKSIELAIFGLLYNPPTDVFRLIIPPGLTMDTGVFNVAGSCKGLDISTGVSYGGNLSEDGANKLLFHSTGLWTPTNPFVWAAGDYISANCIIPIT